MIIDVKVKFYRWDLIYNCMCISVLGASLSQDRGRLEARLEVLGAELESQKKLNERDTDALKIKTKIIDDQTETIRRLKEVLLILKSLSCPKTKTCFICRICFLETHLSHLFFSSAFLLSSLCRSAMIRSAGCAMRRSRPRRGSRSSWRRRHLSRRS